MQRLILFLDLCLLAPHVADRDSNRDINGALQVAVDGQAHLVDRHSPMMHQAGRVRGKHITRNPDGEPSCPCIETHRTPVDCDSVIAVEGKCLKAIGSGEGSAYVKKVGGWFSPVDYGEKCQVQKQPGLEDCSDPNTGLPWDKACEDGQTGRCRVAYCDLEWCYVDPADCDLEYSAPSNWLGDPPLYFSYATCGTEDTWSTVKAEHKKTGECPPAEYKIVWKTWPSPRSCLAESVRVDNSCCAHLLQHDDEDFRDTPNTEDAVKEANTVVEAGPEVSRPVELQGAPHSSTPHGSAPKSVSVSVGVHVSVGADKSSKS